MYEYLVCMYVFTPEEYYAPYGIIAIDGLSYHVGAGNWLKDLSWEQPVFLTAHLSSPLFPS